MKKRFPSVESIAARIEVSHPMNIYPAMTGAISGLYEIASEEFDRLRGLAMVSLAGDEESREALRGYLEVQSVIAELYDRDDKIAERGKCRFEVEITAAG